MGLFKLGDETYQAEKRFEFQYLEDPLLPMDPLTMLAKHDGTQPFSLLYPPPSAGMRHYDLSREIMTLI